MMCASKLARLLARGIGRSAPKPIDLRREKDDALPQRGNLVERRSQQLRRSRLIQRHPFQKRRRDMADAISGLCESLANLQLDIASNRRWLALHGSEPIRSADEGQG